MDNVIKVKEEKEIIDNKKSISFFINIILSLIVVIGVIAGTLYIYFLNDSKNENIIMHLVKEFLDKRISSNFLSLFISVFFSIACYLIFIFIFGFSPILVPFIVCFPLIKGIALGVILSYIYSTYHWSGLLYSAFIEIPLNLILIFFIVIASREAIKLSINIYRVLSKKENIIRLINIKRYIFIFIVLFLISILISGMYAMMNFIFFSVL